MELDFVIRDYLFSFGIFFCTVEEKQEDICLQSVCAQNKFHFPTFSYLKSEYKYIYILDKSYKKVKTSYGSLDLFTFHHHNNIINLYQYEKKQKYNIHFNINKDSFLYDFCLKNYKYIFGYDESDAQCPEISLYLHGLRYCSTIEWFESSW